ncbi:MAG: type II secretion system protein [Blastocatellia bacterium]
MTGRTSEECGVRSAEFVGHDELRHSNLFRKIFTVRSRQSAFRNQRGFSLLELMIAIFILIILLSVALPTYQRSVQHAREIVLRENLWQMRRAIDQYATDKGKLPQTLEDLVEGKYLREMPIDPILEKAEWDQVMGEDTTSPDADQGLKDVRSLAEGADSENKAYKEY